MQPLTKRLTPSVFSRALAWSILQAGIKLLGQLTLGKTIALWFGPAGLAWIGQFQNLLYLQQNLGPGAIQNSLVQALNQPKYLAGKGGPSATGQEARQGLLGFAWNLGLVLCLLGALVWAFTYSQVGARLTGVTLPLWLYLALTFGLVFPTFFYWALAYHSAVQDYRRYALLNVQQTLWSVGLFVVGAWLGGKSGACLGLVLSQIPVGLTALKGMKEAGFPLKSLAGRLRLGLRSFATDHETYGLWPLVALSLYSVLSTQLVLLGIRSYLLHRHSMAEAGCWEALMRLSNVWVPVVSVLLTSYYLPDLSRSVERKAYLLNSLKASLSSAGLVAVYAAAVMAFRQPVVALLFSEEFLPLLSILGLQLGADILKAACWGLHHGLLARRKAKILTFLDLAYQSILLGGLATGLAHDRWESVVWLYAIATLVQLLATVVVWWMDSLRIPAADGLNQNSSL